jgi:hypothetical protein
MSELVDGDIVFRGMATCEDSDGSRVAEYFIVPRRKGGFVMFSVTPAQAGSSLADHLAHSSDDSLTICFG